MFQYYDFICILKLITVIALSTYFCDLKLLAFKVRFGASVDIIVVTPSAARWRQRCSTDPLTQIWKKPNVKDYRDKPRETTWQTKFTKYSLVKAVLIKIL